MAPAMPGRRRRVLVAVPAYNEQPTIADVVRGIRTAVPDFDLLVVNDASTDGTRDAVAALEVTMATHLANLGYGRALQTAIKYAQRHRYDALVTVDADGQHNPCDIRRVFDRACDGGHDLMLGSRFVEPRTYAGEPVARQIGMHVFSLLLWLVTGQRVYDTSSGLKVIDAGVFELLTRRPFVDFHAESLVYLIKTGYSVGECPITVEQRRTGSSMYTALSSIKYPFKVCFLIVLSAIEATFMKRGVA
jgi:glycosyltransferase involved in cell wall biosynthesis